MLVDLCVALLRPCLIDGDVEGSMVDRKMGNVEFHRMRTVVGCLCGYQPDVVSRMESEQVCYAFEHVQNVHQGSSTMLVGCMAALSSCRRMPSADSGRELDSGALLVVYATRGICVRSTSLEQWTVPST